MKKVIRAQKKRKHHADATSVLKSVGGVSLMVIGIANLPSLVSISSNILSPLIEPVASSILSGIDTASSLLQIVLYEAFDAFVMVTIVSVKAAIVQVKFLVEVARFTVAMCYVSCTYLGFRLIWPGQFLLQVIKTRPPPLRLSSGFLGLTHLFLYFLFGALIGVLLGLSLFLGVPVAFRAAKRKLQPYFKRYECCVCFEHRNYFQSAKIHSHQKTQICKACIRDYTKAKLLEAGVSNSFVRCPIRDCSRPLTESDLLHCRADKMTVNTFNHFAALRFIHSFPCPKCSTAIRVTEDQRKSAESIVSCSKCKSTHLLQKLLSAPLPKNNEVKLLMNLATQGGWQFCPCGELVERSDGCNVMNHAKCGNHFCYLCGMKLQGYQASHYPKGSFQPCVQRI